MSEELLADRYVLRRELGAGGMGRVVEAHDRVLDRAVAIKLLHTQLSGDRTVRERFLSEARSAARFSHPNAVAVYDTGSAEGVPYIVMELVRGEDLAAVLRREGALEPSRAVEIASQSLAALAAAHDVGLVHRDVKPANIMLPDSGGVKLADFGIAKSVHAATDLTATGQVFGTPQYLSPEQAGGEPASPATDVYAMGVVLYEMLTGRPPFTGDNAISVALAHRQEPPPSLRRAGVDAALAALVHRALEKDPTDRFPDAGAMRTALRAVASGAPPEALTRTQVIPPERTGRQTASRPAARTSAPPLTPAEEAGRRWWLWIIVIMLLLLGALFAWSWLQTLQLPDLDDLLPTTPATEPADTPEPEPAPAPEPEPEPAPEPEPLPEPEPEPAPAPVDPPAEEPGPPDEPPGQVNGPPDEPPGQQ